MDLIERYLAAIGRNLPGKQAPDIEAELRDLLLSRVEEQEERLGRPLTREELEALLIDFGHPLTVAGRYRRTQHLIGPEVFPFWWAAVKVMLSIVAGVYLVLIAIGALSGKTPAEFNRSVPSVWYVAIYLFGLITLAFMGFERFGKTAFLQKWKPGNLPPALKQRSRFEIAAEIGGDVVFVAWWSGLIHFRNWLPAYPGALGVELAPVWAAWHWPILAYYVVEAAANLIALARPGWITANAAILSGRYLAGVVILTGLLRAGHWLTVSSPTIPPHAMAIVQANFDLGMRVGIGMTILGMVVRVVIEARRWRSWRRVQLGAA
jgi:hypothetical protein